MYSTGYLADHLGTAPRTRRRSGRERNERVENQRNKKRAKDAAAKYYKWLLGQIKRVRADRKRGKNVAKEVRLTVDMRRDQKPSKFFKHLSLEITRLLRKDGLTVRTETEEITVEYHGSGLLNPTTYITILSVAW